MAPMKNQRYGQQQCNIEYHNHGFNAHLSRPYQLMPLVNRTKCPVMQKSNRTSSSEEDDGKSNGNSNVKAESDSTTGKPTEAVPTANGDKKNKSSSPNNKRGGFIKDQNSIKAKDGNFLPTLRSQCSIIEWEIDRLISPLTQKDPLRLKKLEYKANEKGNSYQMVFFQYEIPESYKNLIKWSPSSGLVHFTPFWKIILSTKSPKLQQIRSICPYYPEKVVSYKGFHALQGVWVHYHDARFLAQHFCWKIKGELVPIFGENFPVECHFPLPLELHSGPFEALASKVRETLVINNSYPVQDIEAARTLKELNFSIIKHMQSYQVPLEQITYLDRERVTRKRKSKNSNDKDGSNSDDSNNSSNTSTASTNRDSSSPKEQNSSNKTSG